MDTQRGVKECVPTHRVYQTVTLRTTQGESENISHVFFIPKPYLMIHRYRALALQKAKGSSPCLPVRKTIQLLTACVHKVDTLKGKKCGSLFGPNHFRLACIPSSYWPTTVSICFISIRSYWPTTVSICFISIILLHSLILYTYSSFRLSRRHFKIMKPGNEACTYLATMVTCKCLGQPKIF